MSTMPTNTATGPVSAAITPARVEEIINDNISPNTVLLLPEDNVHEVTISNREARNLAEKQRRDKLNASINELAQMVPHVVDSPRRMDKTAVLRLATHGLRLQHVFGKTVNKRSRFLHSYNNQSMTNALLHLLDSFFITITCHGQIVLITDSVDQSLGHKRYDLYGQNILQITHPDDQQVMKHNLIPKNIKEMFSKLPVLSHEMKNMWEDIDRKLRSDKRSFTVRLARARTRFDAKIVYEYVRFDGCFRRSDYATEKGCKEETDGSNVNEVTLENSSHPIVSQLIRRSRTFSTNSSYAYGCVSGVGGNLMTNPTQCDNFTDAALHGVSGNDIVLVAMARVIHPANIINRPLESNSLEYRTRHLIDGRIVECDQRISLVAGYLNEEVRDLSPFSFMHQDDVRWVVVALRQMYDSNSKYGESYFRLLSRNGTFIYLHTKGFLEIDSKTNKVHSFVCINSLLDEEVGRCKVQEMKNKFSIIINGKVPNNSVQDAPASQNPQQLERIVMYLIEDLHKKRNDIDMLIDNSESKQRNANMINMININNRTFKKYPKQMQQSLSLVAPEPESVKNSISQSVSAVNVTAAKKFTLKISDNDVETITNSIIQIEDCKLPRRPSVLNMHGWNNCSISTDETSYMHSSPNSCSTASPSEISMSISSSASPHSSLSSPLINILHHQTQQSQSLPLSQPILQPISKTEQHSELKRLLSRPPIPLKVQHVSVLKSTSLNTLDTKTNCNESDNVSFYTDQLLFPTISLTPSEEEFVSCHYYESENQLNMTSSLAQTHHSQQQQLMSFPDLPATIDDYCDENSLNITI